MNDWIGVTYTVGLRSLPKQELLLFDRIAVMDLDSTLRYHRERAYDHGRPYIADQLEWLEEAGFLIRTPPVDTNFLHEETNQADLQLLKDLSQLAEGLPIDIPGGGINSSHPRFAEIYQGIQQHTRIYWDQTSVLTRVMAAQMRKHSGMNTVSLSLPPVASSQLRPDTQQHPTLDDLSSVAHIVLTQLPVPNKQETPIESILEFKSDPDSRNKLLALRLWMRDVARAKIAPDELEEKIAYLISEYEKHLKLHRMKTTAGFLESIITIPAEITEDLVKLKWSKAAKLLFTAKHRKLGLLEAEAKAPGREIAYVVSARNQFSGE